MEELLTCIADLSSRAKELRADPVFGALGYDGDRLRKAFRDLETNVRDMERKVADLYDLLRYERQGA